LGTTTINSKKNALEEREELYIDTAEAEHIEMYLKAIWYIREQGEMLR
jgi:DtxR family transcriptional regulator, Mn-dependent transcriptional regulator